MSRPLAIVTHICRLILACTFVFSGFVKSIDPWGTAIKVNEYLSIYGMESLMPWSMAFSIWLCGAELMMGCMLLFRVRIRLVSIFAFLSMIFFTLLTFLSATWLPVEDCGCFGDAVKLTPWQTFAKNLVLLPLAGIVWYRYRRDRIFAFNRLEVALTLLFFVSTMGLGTYCYLHLPLIDFLPYKVGVNIYEAMRTQPEEADGEAVETVLVYRNRHSGEVREFALDDPEWQNAAEWEWLDTRVESGTPEIRPLVSEFNLGDADGDATEEILTMPGRVYLLCVTSFESLSERCEERLGALADRALAEGATALCITPEPLHGVSFRSFAGSAGVRCYNIDASTLKTMLRAKAGVVVLDGGTITDKRNCRDIRP